MSMRILKTLFVIIGTLIGAGFASGQEIYIFFYKYGWCGIIGIIISAFIIGIVIQKVLNIAREENITNYKDLMKKIIKKEKNLKKFNMLINIFILITFYIMIAGFGAYFQEQIGINSIIGSLILAILCFLVFLKDISGLIKVNQIIIPVLIVSLIIIGIQIIDINKVCTVNNYLKEDITIKWCLDSILYSSYNTILLIPALINLRKMIKSKKESRLLSLLVIICVIILSLIIFFMLFEVDVKIEELEMPVVYVVSRYSILFKTIYGFIILSSIFTTSISLGTSFLENVAYSKQDYKRYAILICMSSVIVSKVGFANLVNFLYPVFGYIGMIQIIKIMRLNKYKKQV